MLEQFFNTILPSIEHFHLLGYWVAFFAALLETALVVGLLLPGSTVLLLLGALSAAGHLDFGDLLWFAVAGAILGDNLNYWLGSRYGHRWIRDGVGFLKPEHFEQARGFFDSHGAKSVFLGRFIPSIKEITPFVAGTVGMRRRNFFFWNVLGGIGWGLQWIGGGYLFGQSLNLAQAWMSRAGMTLFVLLLIGLLLWLAKRALSRHGPQVWRLLVSLGRSIAGAVRANPFVRRLMRRHPRLLRLAARRTDRSHFCGLPLTLLVLAFGYVLALFAGVVEDLLTSDSLIALDHAAAQLIAAFRAPQIIPPFIWITDLGASLVIAPLLLIACAILWLLRRPWQALPLLASSLGAAAFSTLGKFAFHRPRPVEAVLLETSWSFPSGHATIAVACYGFLGYLLIRSAERWNQRVNRFFLTAILILLIGLSRILLGVHYLSDVWAGYLVGTLWLIIGISLSEWLRATGRLAWRVPVEASRRRAAIGLGMAALIGYLGFASHWQPPRHTPASAATVEITRPINEILREQHIAHTETLLGEPTQPLAFAVIARDADALLSALGSAGWRPADRAGLRTMLRLARQGMDYTTAPLAPAFWNRRINDFALERAMGQGGQDGNRSIATVRLWRTPYRTAGEQVFVGVAREYTGIRWGVLHQIAADVDAAADRLVESLKNSGQALRHCRSKLVEPMIGDYLMGGRFFSRGALWLLDLTPSGSPAGFCRGPAPEP